MKTLLLSLAASLGLIFASVTISPEPVLERATVTVPTAPEGAILVDVNRVPIPAESKYLGEAAAFVVFGEQPRVNKFCGVEQENPQVRTIACVNAIGGWAMALPNPCHPEFAGEDYAAVVCHEKGHILGWRHEMASKKHLPPAAEGTPNA